MNNNSYIWIMVIAAVFFWGSNFNAIAALDTNLPAIVSSIIRFAIASVIFLFAIFIYRGSNKNLDLREIGYLVLLGFLGVFCFNYAIFAGMKLTTPINGALIMANMPLISVIFSKLFLNIKVTLNQYIGLILGVTGVFLVITQGNITTLSYSLGDIWIIVACFCGGLYAVLTKKLVAHIPPVQVTYWTILSGTVFMSVSYFTFLSDGFSYGDYLAISGLSWSLLAYMGIAGTVMAYYFWTKGCQVLGPEKTSITTNLIPIFTLCISFIMGKSITMIQIVGMIIIICGVLLVTNSAKNLSILFGRKQRT
ncbi:DMT family transporter [Xenorhabdus sp. TH1]|uniref:DMT family transporter n=1 Tax=Xenorhabdus sp. TH1 TaxID=3130166 RepID=UPI0030D05E89